MAVRKSVEETITVGGSPADVIALCEQALLNQKFKRVEADRTLSQVRGDYKPLVGTLHGDIHVSLSPQGPNTRLDVRATAAVDNIYALGRSPGGKLIDKFKQGLAQAGVLPAAPDAPTPAGLNLSGELERLADMHARDVLDHEEFRAAKARLLGN